MAFVGLASFIVEEENDEVAISFQYISFDLLFSLYRPSRHGRISNDSRLMKRKCRGEKHGGDSKEAANGRIRLKR